VADGKVNESETERVRLDTICSFDGIRLSSRQVTRRQAEALMKRDPFGYAVDDEHEVASSHR
jgi:hypothetical protein